jgi:hypothetical protein
MRRLKSARRVTQSFAAFPVPAGTEPGGIDVMQEYPSVGEELDHIAVRFTWRGQEYEAKFDDFDGSSEPIPEFSVKSAVQTR